MSALVALVAACGGGESVLAPSTTYAPMEDGTAPSVGASTTTTEPDQAESGSTQASSTEESTFLTVGDGAFFGRVVSVEFGDEWTITPSDVAVTPGAAAGTTVGPAILHLDDGTSLEVPAGTPGGNACIELVRPEDWAGITGLENPTLEQLRRNDIPNDCFTYGALTPGGQVAWFDTAAYYSNGDPTAKLLRRPLRLVEEMLIVEEDLGFPLAPDVEILCFNQLTIEEYAADLPERASRSVIQISTSTGEVTNITCLAEL